MVRDYESLTENKEGGEVPLFKSSVLLLVSVISICIQLWFIYPSPCPKENWRKTSMNGFVKRLFTSLSHFAVYVVVGHKFRNTLPTNSRSSRGGKSSWYGAAWSLLMWLMRRSVPGTPLTLPVPHPLLPGAPLWGERLRTEASVTCIAHWKWSFSSDLQILLPPFFLTTSSFPGNCSQRKYPFTSVHQIKLTFRESRLGGTEMKPTQFLFCPALQGAPV